MQSKAWKRQTPSGHRLGSLLLLAIATILVALVAAAAPAAQATARHRHHARHARKHVRHARYARHARKHRRHHRRHRRHVVHRKLAAVSTGSSTAAPLVFGIYPGGAAGTVGPSGPIKPENSTLRLQAIEALRAPGKPFFVHVYAAYTGPNGWSVSDQIGQQISQYSAAGFGVEVVLTYRPADGGSSSDVNGFTQFARQTVRDFGSDPEFASLQVTNEANVGGAPNASDGYYADVKDALIQGVIGAKAEARADAFNQVKVGFNWAYSTDGGESSFWKYLGRGGSAFINSLDWVGLDAYPATWQTISGGLSSGTAAAIKTDLATLRDTYMPLAGIPARVPLHISENGYPTGPGRTQAMQVTAMEAAVGAVNSARGTYNVSDYRWFDLRDNDSASTSFEDQYGIMTDTYTPKAAFSVYHNLVTALS